MAIIDMLGKHLVSLTILTCVCAQDWSAYHGGVDNTKHSRLSQITTENVARLKLAWRFDTGDAGPGTEMQCNPLVVSGVMYATSPKLRVVAVDAVTGKQIWRFDPHGAAKVTGSFRNRGLNYWESGGDARIYFASGPWLYALNAKTGQPVAGFGQNGRVDLRRDLGRDASSLTITVTTPGVVFGDKLILGSLVSEGLPAAPGHIRAFDVRTGAVKWMFRTIPAPGEPGYETWPKDAHTYIGGVNSWAGLALDEKRGLLYVPTGSAAFDFYGANRIGDNLYANCLLALRAGTGELVWHFQFVKHDVWDRDLPSAPTLVTVQHNGKRVDAIAQITKSGHVWVFDRETGESLFPFEERDVPASDIDGEVLSRKQVLPLKPAPFARQQLTEDVVTNRTPQAREVVLGRLRTLKSGPQFTPPSREGTIIFPGFDGGGEWGGGAFDPDTGLFYVNANEMAWILRLVPKQTGATQNGRTLYLRNCAACHREDLAGSPPSFPSLKNLASKTTDAQALALMKNGAGRMPGFARLKDPALDAILRYLMKGEQKEVIQTATEPSPIDQKYTIDGYNKFLDPDGYPAVAPPWGTLNAINLNTGEYAWKIPFGEIPALVAQGLRHTGSENYGGAVVTSGGLLFIGATDHDAKFHAYNKRTGALLWEFTMDAAGNATPATYEVNGRQYVVIGAGGGKSGTKSGGSYYAFALPE